MRAVQINRVENPALITLPHLENQIAQVPVVRIPLVVRIAKRRNLTIYAEVPRFQVVKKIFKLVLEVEAIINVLFAEQPQNLQSRRAEAYANFSDLNASGGGSFR